jgi:predicted ribosome quality control (RQC) complex YloA/Tae2 family protein
MHNSYFLLRLLAVELHQTLQGKLLTDCYSQDKDELIMVFGNGEATFYIKAILTAQFTCLAFPPQLHRAKANAVTLFTEALGEQVQSVAVTHCDRSFELQLTHNKSFVFKMHGNRSNILFAVDNVVQDVFKHSLSKDLTLHLPSLAKPISFERDTFLAYEGSLQSIYPVFDRELLSHLETAEFMQADKATKWLHIKTMLDALRSGNIYLIDSAFQKPAISLLKPDTPHTVFQSAIQALNQFVRTYLHKAAYFDEKQRLTDIIKRKISHTKAYIATVETQIKALKERADYRLMADIIMANLHAIPAQAKEATLYDFVHNKEIHIVFKSGYTPQKTAELYYKKAKNSHLQPQQLQKRVDNKLEELKRLEEWLQSLADVTELKQLRLHPAYALLNNEHQISPQKEHTIAKIEEFEGYSITVGTSAQVNDMLLASARKDDWWFHARNFAGSHVWVKAKNPNAKLPKSVLERAGLLAALHSKGKRETLCPVIYTQKKYLRKFKGAKKGEVRVERENVLMIHIENAKSLYKRNPA